MQNLVPVIFSEVYDNWHQHRERLFLLGLKDVQKVIILEEAHGSVRNLEVDTAYAFDDPLKKSGDKVLYFVDLAHFENFLKLREEKCLFYAVSKWPILKQAF